MVYQVECSIHPESGLHMDEDGEAYFRRLHEGGPYTVKARLFWPQIHGVHPNPTVIYRNWIGIWRSK